MNAEPTTRVVRVTSLDSFLSEVSTQPGPGILKPVLRLLNRQIAGQHSAALLLSLQGVNTQGEIVWLCEAHTVSWLYGQPFGSTAESVYAGLRNLGTVVREYLSDRGYDVRAGDYGLPDDIKPLAATFACAKWVRVGECDWKVEAVTTRESINETTE